MQKNKKIIKGILLIILGSTIISFGNYNFNYQNNITEGGVLGLLLLFKNLFDISPSITSLVIDLSLFALGSKFFGKKFLIYSLLSTITFSSTYKIWENIGFIVPSFSNNMIIGALFAGVAVGIGVGLVVRGGGAAGGDDVIALLVSKFTNLKINHVYLITDISVLLLSLTYLDFKQILFSIIAVTTSGKLIGLIYNEQKDEEDVDKSSDELEYN